MASIKTHVYRGTNAGTTSCDFRGPNFIGHDQGDEHRTIPELEIDPAPQELVDLVLKIGPEINQVYDKFKQLESGFAGEIASIVGLEGSGPIGLRIGVWDN